MMEFDRREDEVTPLGWGSSTDDMEELKIDIFPDQTRDEAKIAQPVLPERDAEESRKHRRKHEGRPRASAHRRKKKPPGLPKRPLSAYNVFFQQERLKIQEEEKGQAKLGFNDFGKVIGSRWKELSDEERQKYNARAKEDTVRYHNEMDAIKDLNKRKKEEPEKEGNTNENPNLLPWATSSKGSKEAANSVLPKDSVSTELTLPSPFPHGLHHQGLPDPQRINWNHPVSSYNGELFSSSRNHLPAASHYESHPGVSIPPGMEITLPDASGRERKYTVRYTVYSMRRGDAENFMKSFSDGGRIPERQYPDSRREPMMHHQAQAQYPTQR